jgi:hypothetical protein
MSALPTAEDDLLVVGEMGAPVFIVGRQPPGFALGAVGDDRALSHHYGLSLSGSDPSPVKPQERTNSAASFSCLSASSNSSASGCPSQMCASSCATALWKIVNPPPSIQHDEPPRLFLGSQPSGVEEQIRHHRDRSRRSSSARGRTPLHRLAADQRRRRALLHLEVLDAAPESVVHILTV